MGRDLKDRVQQTAVARRGGEVATSAPTSIEDDIRSMQQQFEMAMPRGAEAVQLIRDAITALRTTRGLAECDRASILGGLMTCAQLGLRPGVLGHAWLLPFYDNRSKTKKAQLVIGYQGMVELAHRTGRIASLIARTVHEHDHFDVDYGLADTLVHKPVLTGDRGRAIAYYAIAKYQGGGYSFFVMSHPDMEAYRDRHAMAKDRQGNVVGPWRDHFEQMAHKTCVRQLSKWMPKSTEFATAIEADSSVRLDFGDPRELPTRFQYPDDEATVAVDGELVDTTTGEAAPQGDGQGPPQDAPGWQLNDGTVTGQDGAAQ